MNVKFSTEIMHNNLSTQTGINIPLLSVMTFLQFVLNMQKLCMPPQDQAPACLSPNQDSFFRGLYVLQSLKP